MEKRKIIQSDANTFYGLSMSQNLPYKVLQLTNDVNRNEIRVTDDCAEVGCFVKVDLYYPNEIKEKTKVVPFCPINKNANKIDFTLINEFQ